MIYFVFFILGFIVGISVIFLYEISSTSENIPRFIRNTYYIQRRFSDDGLTYVVYRRTYLFFYHEHTFYTLKKALEYINRCKERDDLKKIEKVESVEEFIKTHNNEIEYEEKGSGGWCD